MTSFAYPTHRSAPSRAAKHHSKKSGGKRNKSKASKKDREETQEETAKPSKKLMAIDDGTGPYGKGKKGKLKANKEDGTRGIDDGKGPFRKGILAAHTAEVPQEIDDGEGPYSEVHVETLRIAQRMVKELGGIERAKCALHALELLSSESKQVVYTSTIDDPPKPYRSAKTGAPKKRAGKASTKKRRSGQ